MKRTVDFAKHARLRGKASRGGVAKRFASIVVASLAMVCLFAGAAFSAESEGDVMVKLRTRRWMLLRARRYTRSPR